MKITPKLAELLGAYVGDGSMSKNGRIGVVMTIAASREEKGWLDHLASIFQEIFHHNFKPRWRTDAYVLQTGNQKICRFFHDIGFPVGGKTSKVRVPEVLTTTCDTSIYKSFLRGYFDADGCISFERRSYGKYAEFKRTHHYYPRIFISSISKDLIQIDIKMMLDSIGIRYGMYEKMPSKKGKHKVYIIVVKGTAQLDLWMNQIGSFNPVHLTKYLMWKRFGFCPPRSTVNQRIAALDPSKMNGGPAGI